MVKTRAMLWKTFDMPDMADSRRIQRGAVCNHRDYPSAYALRRYGNNYTHPRCASLPERTPTATAPQLTISSEHCPSIGLKTGRSSGKRLQGFDTWTK